jgi:hypothetical protein
VKGIRPAAVTKEIEMFYPRTKEEADEFMKQVRAKRAAADARQRRRIEMGYEPGKIHANGGISIHIPFKGFKPYSTRQLVEMVRERMDIAERGGGDRVCYINNKHQLQIRGKHLRRLLKAMPGVRQQGRKLVQDPS